MNFVRLVSSAFGKSTPTANSTYDSMVNSEPKLHARVATGFDRDTNQEYFHLIPIDPIATADGTEPPSMAAGSQKIPRDWELVALLEQQISKFKFISMNDASTMEPRTFTHGEVVTFSLENVRDFCKYLGLA